MIEEERAESEKAKEAVKQGAAKQHGGASDISEYSPASKLATAPRRC